MLPAERKALALTLYRALGYEVREQAVADFHNSTARTKIISCPARTSKSYAGWKEALPDIFIPGIELARTGDAESMLCWIVAPNFDLAKEFDYAWSDLVSRKDTVGFDYELGRCTNVVRQGHMEITIVWGKNKAGDDVTSRVVVKSAANEKSLQSEQVTVAILSEAARLDPVVWRKYLSTRCTRSIWPTTPDIQAAWIWEHIESGKKEPTLGIESFHFTGNANPKYDWHNYWTEHAKAESLVDGQIVTLPDNPNAPPSKTNGHDCFDELVGCKAQKEDGFAEQFCGRWVFHRGRVVPLREQVSEAGAPAHVIDYDPDWASHAIFTVACDYGFVDHSVAGFWMTGPDEQIILRRCVYESGLTADQFVDAIEREWMWMNERFGLHRARAHRYLGDPKKPEVESILKRRGLPIYHVDKLAQADRNAGHLQLMTYLATDIRTGQPRMHVHRDCKAVINEWRVLRRSERVKNEGSTASLVGSDDAYDMARYFVQSRPHGKMQVVSDTDFDRARRLVIREQQKRRMPTVPTHSGVGTVAWRAA
jgi:hypothetical protein